MCSANGAADAMNVFAQPAPQGTVFGAPPPILNRLFTLIRKSRHAGKEGRAMRSLRNQRRPERGAHMAPPDVVWARG